MTRRWVAFGWIYDALLAPWERLGLSRWRRRLVAPASGCVLEIGTGTGRNLPFYRQARRLVLTEPDPAMLSRARPRAAAACCPVELVVADAQALPFRSGSFDEVVATLAFCTIPDPGVALAEVERVLVPGGVLRLLEHVRTPRESVARWQDALTPFWRQVAGGCHLNRRTLELTRAHGFAPMEIDTGLDGWLVAAVLRGTRPSTGPV